VKMIITLCSYFRNKEDGEMTATTNGKAMTVTQGTLEHGTVLVEGVRIIAVGEVIEIPEDAEALKAIPINAAEIIGVADRVGSPEVGKDADLVVFSGHPFDYRTAAKLVLVWMAK
jgi:imidazolonepropionase-like amidohydrolase